MGQRGSRSRSHHINSLHIVILLYNSKEGLLKRCPQNIDQKILSILDQYLGQSWKWYVARMDLEFSDVCVCVCVTPCTKGFNATVSTTTTPQGRGVRLDTPT